MPNLMHAQHQSGQSWWRGTTEKGDHWDSGKCHSEERKKWHEEVSSRLTCARVTAWARNGPAHLSFLPLRLVLVVGGIFLLFLLFGIPDIYLWLSNLSNKPNKRMVFNSWITSSHPISSEQPNTTERYGSCPGVGLSPKFSVSLPERTFISLHQLAYVYWIRM